MDVPSSIEEFIEWANSTPAVTWGGSKGVKDRWRELNEQH